MNEFGVRKATEQEIEYDGEPLDLANDFVEILERGHVIDTFSSGGSTRVVRIFGDKEARDGDPLLGYGDDANIENALRRARDTYRRREEEGLPDLGDDDEKWPEAGAGLLTGGPTKSPLDVITYNQGFRAWKDEDEIVVWTEWGRYSNDPLEGRGPNLQAAADRLCVLWLTEQ